MKIQRDSKGRFVKGGISPNKGKKLVYVTERNIRDNPSKRPEVAKKISDAKFKGGWIDDQGYKRIKNKKKEHQIIWCSQNLPYIPKGFCVHHLDFNKLNNNSDNLVLLPFSFHTTIHQLKRWRKL